MWTICAVLLAATPPAPAGSDPPPTERDDRNDSPTRSDRNDLARTRALAAAHLNEAPADPARWVALAATIDDPDQAVPLLNEALRLDPDHLPALAALGRALAAAGRRAEGLDHLDHALALAPDDLRIRLAVAEVRRDLGRAAAILAERPDDPDVALLVAKLDPDRAAAVLTGVDDPDRRVLAARVELALRRGEQQMAATTLDALRRHFPDDPRIPQIARWITCLRQRTIEPAALSAHLDARNAAIADPTTSAPFRSPLPDETCPAALALDAIARARSGDTNGAVQVLEAAVAIAPDDDALAGDLGRALLSADRAADASPLLARASAARPPRRADRPRVVRREAPARRPRRSARSDRGPALRRSPRYRPRPRRSRPDRRGRAVDPGRRRRADPRPSAPRSRAVPRGGDGASRGGERAPRGDRARGGRGRSVGRLRGDRRHRPQGERCPPRCADRAAAGSRLRRTEGGCGREPALRRGRSHAPPGRAPPRRPVRRPAVGLRPHPPDAWIRPDGPPRRHPRGDAGLGAPPRSRRGGSTCPSPSSARASSSSPALG